MVKRRIVILAEPEVKRVVDVDDELIEGVWISVDVAKAATIRSLFTQLWQEETCLRAFKHCPIEAVNFILKGRRLNLDSSAYDLILDGDEISIRHRSEESPVRQTTSRKRKRSETSRHSTQRHDDETSEKRHRETPDRKAHQSQHKREGLEKIAYELMRSVRPGYLVKVFSAADQTLSPSRSSERRVSIDTGKVVKIVSSGDTYFLVIKKRESNVTLTLDVRSIEQVNTLQGTKEIKVYEKGLRITKSHKTKSNKKEERIIIEIPLLSFPPRQSGLLHPSMGDVEIPDAIWATKDLHKLNEWLSAELQRITRRVRRQVEFYFSDQNWASDKYLQNLAKKYPQGIPLEKIANFNCVREMTSDLKLIREACSEDCSNFVLNEFDCIVRRADLMEERRAESMEEERVTEETCGATVAVATVDESSPAVVLKFEQPVPPSSVRNNGLAAFLQYVNEMGATWANRPSEVPIKCEQDSSLPPSEKPTAAPEIPAAAQQPKRHHNPLLDD